MSQAKKRKFGTLGPAAFAASATASSSEGSASEAKSSMSATEVWSEAKKKLDKALLELECGEVETYVRSMVSIAEQYPHTPGLFCHMYRASRWADGKEELKLLDWCCNLHATVFRTGTRSQQATITSAFPENNPFRIRSAVLLAMGNMPGAVEDAKVNLRELAGHAWRDESLLHGAYKLLSHTYELAGMLCNSAWAKESMVEWAKRAQSSSLPVYQKEAEEHVNGLLKKVKTFQYRPRFGALSSQEICEYLLFHFKGRFLEPLAVIEERQFSGKAFLAVNSTCFASIVSHMELVNYISAWMAEEYGNNLLPVPEQAGPGSSKGEKKADKESAASGQVRVATG